MNQFNSTHRIKGILMVLFACILWGASGVSAQFLFQDRSVNPEWLVVVRLIISGSLLLIYDSIKNHNNILNILKNKRDRRQLLLFAVFGLASVQYTYFIAIKYSNAATSTILQYLMPVIIVVYVALRQWKCPSRREIIALCLAIFGTFLLITKGNINTLAISSSALFWGITSAFASAFYTIQPKYLLSKWRSSLVIGWGMLIGGIMMIPISPPWQVVGFWDLAAFSNFIFIIIFGTVIPFCMYSESILYILPSETGILASIQPFSAVVLSIFLLDVSFGLTDCIGGFCILSIVFILTEKDKQS